jgi:hypothetical protein
VVGAGGAGDPGPAPPGAQDDAGATARVPDASFTFQPADATTAALPDTAAQTCAAESHQAQGVPVDVFFLLDGSGSMDDPVGTTTKWEMVRKALASFFADPSSAGLSVGVRFFPFDGLLCSSDADCRKLFPGVTLPNGVCNLSGLCTPAGGPPGQECVTSPDGQTGCPQGVPCVAAPGLCRDSTYPCMKVGEMCTGTSAGQQCVPAGGSCSVGLALECSPAIYANPQLDFTLLPAGGAAATAALGLRSPGGDGTPLQQAVQGGLTYVTQYLAAHPGHQGALVLVTDGHPESDCQENENTIVQAAADAYAGPHAVRTYTIGVFGPKDLGWGKTILDEVSAAAGTTKAFVLEPNTNLTATFLGTLGQIRGEVLPCQFSIPPPAMGTLDYGKVNFHYQGGGADEDIGYVADPAHCDPALGGWYYDADPATGGHPTQVVTCPATCARIKSDSGARVELHFGCKTKLIE